MPAWYLACGFWEDKPMGKLMQSLSIAPAETHSVALAGAGGKTTLLFALAREAMRDGLRVAVTTTTHILCPGEQDDLFVTVEEDLPGIDRAFQSGRIIIAGTPAPEGKLSVPCPQVLRHLRENADLLLYEADGSHRMPVKFPNDTEPVILPGTDRVIAVAGLSALGQPLHRVCQRYERAVEALGLSANQNVDPMVAASLLLGGYGHYKGLTVLLNQADTPKLQKLGEQIAELLRSGGVASTIVASLQQEAF